MFQTLSSRPRPALAALALALVPACAPATEGGTSHYFPGAYNDFFMNKQMDPGVYFRDDLVYYGGRLPDVTLGRNTAVNADLDMWLTIAKVGWVSDFEILGARYGASLFMPIVFDAHLRGTVETGPRQGSGSGNEGGMGDMGVSPLSLVWKWEDFNVKLDEFIIMPTGFYNPDQIVNLGKNYWSFDSVLGLTWVHPTRGHEISFNVGFLSNTKNDATQYQSGDEFHLDYTVAQHFSEEFGIGVTGFYFSQLTNDKSPMLNQLSQVVNSLNQVRDATGQPLLPQIGGFQGEASGIGPIVRYSPKFGDKQVHFIGKWIHEYDVQHRFEGNLGMVSVALNF